MKKMIPTKIFYSYFGISIDGLQVSNSHGVLTDLPDDIVAKLTKEAKQHNSKVDHLHLVALTPIEFEEVEV